MLPLDDPLLAVLFAPSESTPPVPVATAGEGNTSACPGPQGLACEESGGRSQEGGEEGGPAASRDLVGSHELAGALAQVRSSLEDSEGRDGVDIEAFLRRDAPGQPQLGDAANALCHALLEDDAPTNVESMTASRRELIGLLDMM